MSQKGIGGDVIIRCTGCGKIMVLQGKLPFLLNIDSFVLKNPNINKENCIRQEQSTK